MKILSFNKFFWTFRMQFWQSWRKISPKVKNFPSSSAKELRQNNSSLSKELSPPKCFAGHLECSLHNADKIFDDSAKNVRSKCEKSYKIKILSKKSPENVSLDMYHAVVTTARNFVLKAEKIEKTCPFNVNIFFEMSCWTHRMQFWKSWRKNSPKVKNFLSSRAKKLRSNPSFPSTKLLSPNCFAGHLECSLHNADKIFDDSAKKFRSKC